MVTIVHGGSFLPPDPPGNGGVDVVAEGVELLDVEDGEGVEDMAELIVVVISSVAVTGTFLVACQSF